MLRIFVRLSLSDAQFKTHNNNTMRYTFHIGFLMDSLTHQTMNAVIITFTLSRHL